MKEETSSPQEDGLPSCSLSEYCIFVLDELETSSGQAATFSDEEDNTHQQLLAQMQAHIPICPTCSRTLAQLRKERDHQRSLLRTWLHEDEHNVPSTVASILSVVREGQQIPQPLLTPPPECLEAGANNHHDIHSADKQLRILKRYPFGQEQNGKGSKNSKGRKGHAQPKTRWNTQRVRTTLTVAAVLVFLLGSLTIFSRLILFQNHGISSVHTTQSNVIMARSWSSVVMTVVYNHQLIIGNYDPLSGKYSEFARSANLDTTTVDGVSHSGYTLLYHSYDGKKTEYRVAPQNTLLYTVSGQGGSAVWSTHDHSIFISTQQGIVQVDAATRLAKQIWPGKNSIVSPMLAIHFYRNGYLYFSTSGSNSTGTILERVALNTRAVQTVASCENMHDIWLSPYGATIYYICADQNALYAVNSDGSLPRLFRRDVGHVVGFAQDDALIALSFVNAVARVVKLGSSPALDHVLLPLLAPQALPMLPQDIAVAPYGTSLVVKAMYNDHTQKLWYANLVNGQQQRMPISTTAEVKQLIGWSRLQVAKVTPVVQPTMPLSLDAWHQVLMVNSNSQHMTLINNDVANDASTVLNTFTSLPPTTLVDGISRDGKNVLYQFSRSGRTFYYTLSPVAKNGYFYALDNEQAGNALWLSDSQYVLVSTLSDGVRRVNVQTGEVVPLLPHLKIAKLVLYRAPYLYFIGAEDRAAGALYRVNINASGAVPQQVTRRSPGSTFWLSPDGETVYYVNTGSAGQAGLYAVRSDGSNFAIAQPLRTEVVPVGYAADNALMMIRQVQKKFQLVKLGATVQQDHVVLADIAPGAVSLCDTTLAIGIIPICDRSIALAPLGGKLVVEARYDNGSHIIWSIDLATAARFQLPMPTDRPGERQQLIGWNQILSGDG